ncbi:hypothetical protein [Micromonospora chersina]|uniref:hypothetical protein n=1 Tax=Micromonospora chersina TaxID=47854 RepID=UPI0033EC9C4D
MTLPPAHPHQQRKKIDRATAAAPDKRLDPPGEDNGSWTLDNADRGKTTWVTSVATPGQPPELHPGAAAALLKLLSGVNERRTDKPNQENA